MFRRIALTTALLLCALPIAANAQTRHIAVHTADLNLATDAGRAQLHDRIAQAANTVCNVYDSRMSEKARAGAHAACIETASAGARQQYDVMVAAAMDRQKLASIRP